MPTFTQPVQNGQILLAAEVSISGIENSPTYRSSALLDTGAQKTMISPQVVEGLDLTATESAWVSGINGKAEEVNAYRLVIALPVPIILEVEGGLQHGESLARSNLLVAELPFQPKNYDVLLGMDFISRLHVAIVGNICIIST